MHNASKSLNFHINTAFVLAYNTQTRRLTAAMFEAVFADISKYLQRV
jgi:hypothetical protein